MEGPCNGLVVNLLGIYTSKNSSVLSRVVGKRVTTEDKGKGEIRRELSWFWMLLSRTAWENGLEH